MPEPETASFSYLPADGEFCTTRWSLVLRAGSLEPETSGQALEQLCRVYWMPLFMFVRKKGYSKEDAQDLTQEFFARLLAQNWLDRADPKLGRFRSFLLGAATHFLNNEWNRSQRLKRGGGTAFVAYEAVSENEWLAATADLDATPESLYEKKWLHTILATVMRRLKEELTLAGRGRHFDVLKVFLTGHRGSQPYAEAAAELGLSESAVKAAIWRLRQRYGEIFREEVSQTVVDPGETEEEIRHLLRVIR